ncbi:hypothetical protein KAR91_29700 [Candidatus Pacearchaeota archaeon]|nr:hypothetical protein [Candidatus Pacearchaeota archaeon]
MVKQSKPKKPEDTIAKLKAKIKKLEAAKDQQLAALKKMPGVRGGVYGLTFAGLTYSYYHGLTLMLPDFLFQFGGERDRKRQEEFFVEGAVVYLATGPAGVALQTMGIDVYGTLRASIGVTHLVEGVTPNPIIPISAEIARLLGMQGTEVKKIRDATQAGIEVGAAIGLRKDLDDINKELGYWNQIKWQYVYMRVMWAMGMAGGTMMFLLETTPSEVANVAAKLLDAVTPGT